MAVIFVEVTLQEGQTRKGPGLRHWLLQRSARLLDSLALLKTRETQCGEATGLSSWKTSQSVLDGCTHIALTTEAAMQ